MVKDWIGNLAEYAVQSGQMRAGPRPAAKPLAQGALLMPLGIEGSNLYFELSRFSFHAEMLSWTHYLDRMLVLKHICEPDDPICVKANRILLLEEWNSEEPWLFGRDEGDSASSISISDLSGEKLVRPKLEEDRRRYLQFISTKSGLQDWVFHKYDPDFHPSIPHGHFKGRNQPKLDCYLGWTYRGSMQVGRLRRDLIIDLWNDGEFRNLARTAINWYMRNFPRYNWRVDEPQILPRRRK